jgi:hypothetical protein
MDGTGTHIDLGLALLTGLAIGLVPLIIACWPKVITLAAEHRHGAGTLPPGVTPFVAALLSDLDMTNLLACGLMWIIAWTPHQRAVASGDPALGSSAETYLRDSLSPQGSQIADPQKVALSTLAANNPTTYEVRTVMADLRGCSSDDARNLGLLRESAVIRRLLLGLAGCELLAAFLIEGDYSINEPLLFGGLVTAYAALHFDPRSFAGASLTGDLRRLRAGLRNAALATGSIDSVAVRALVPAAATAAETEVWAVAVGCRSAGSEQAASRLRSMARAASGRPRAIRYTEEFRLTSGHLADSLTARLRAIWRLARPRRRGPDGAAPVLW